MSGIGPGYRPGPGQNEWRRADPEFFIAHADLELIRSLPRTPAPAPTELGFFHALLERLRTLPQITIAEIDGPEST